MGFVQGTDFKEAALKYAYQSKAFLMLDSAINPIQPRRFDFNIHNQLKALSHNQEFPT